MLVSHDFRLIGQVAQEIWLCDKKDVGPWKGDIQTYKTHLTKQVIKRSKDLQLKPLGRKRVEKDGKREPSPAPAPVAEPAPVAAPAPPVAKVHEVVMTMAGVGERMKAEFEEEASECLDAFLEQIAAEGLKQKDCSEDSMVFHLPKGWEKQEEKWTKDVASLEEKLRRIEERFFEGEPQWKMGIEARA